MSKYIVTVTPMQRELGRETTKEFSTRKEAGNWFMNRCDELGYHYSFSDKTLEAGGIGHDFRITLTEEGQDDNPIHSKSDSKVVRWQKVRSLDTDRNNSGNVIVQSYDSDKRECQIAGYRRKADGTRSNEFERFTAKKAVSTAWIHLSFEEVKENKNGLCRRNEISLDIDKRQAIFLLENLKAIIDEMVD